MIDNRLRNAVSNRPEHAEMEPILVEPSSAEDRAVAITPRATLLTYLVVLVSSTMVVADQ